MMSGDNFTDGLQETRPVLGDVTNLPSKRAFSMISGELGSKSGDGHVQIMDSGNGHSEFAKKVCLRVENLVKERCKTKCGVDSSENAVSMSKDKQSCASSPVKQLRDIASIAKRTNEMPHLGVTVADNVTELGDLSRDCMSTISLPTCSKQCSENHGRPVSDAVRSHGELLVSRVRNDEDVGVGRLASSKGGSIEWSRLPKSQGSRSFELGKCGGLKDGGCTNLSAEANLLKDCSCPFCLKAAYIWSDLHYQDIKGRLAALKKSQKDASFLVQKFGRGKQTEIPGHGNSDKSSTLESDLMSQWRSLFAHMEDIFVQESSHLENGFVTLKDLRENCKMDLERSTGMPSDKQ